MELEQLLPTFISAAGGGLLNLGLAFNKRFNTWLERWTPEQRYYVVLALTTIFGAGLAILMACTGILSFLNCDKNIGSQLTMSAFAAASGNQVVYNGIKAAAKTTQQTEAKEIAGRFPTNPDGNGGGFG